MRAAAHNATKLQQALGKAERQLNTKGRPKHGTVELFPSEIKTRPELFQPREFSAGLRETDQDFVKQLTRTIGILGELDAIVVIKIGTKFVCVDGHHRIQAYKEAKWAKPIKCEWFGGSVREAVDESMRRNTKDRLNVPQADKMENAWKRVLLDWGSKAEIVKLCGVGEGTVAHMRRVKRQGFEDSPRGKEFRRRLGGGSLQETSWYQAKLAELGVEPKEIDDEVRAERLARRIRSRLEDLLSREPTVTARALELYDPALPKEIARAWHAAVKDNTVTEREEGEAEYGPAMGLAATDFALKRTLETRRKQVSDIEAELQRRANGGVPAEHAGADGVQTER